MRWYLWLLVLIVFAIPIEHRYDKAFHPFIFLPEVFHKHVYFYATDLIALALLGWGLRRREFFDRGALFLWILFGCALVSIIASPLAHNPIRYLRLWQLLTPFVLFSFLANGMPEEQRHKMVRILLMALVTAALLQTAIAIAQYFHQGSLGIRLLREPKFGPLNPESPQIPVAEGSRWVFDRIFDCAPEGMSILRAHGTMNHPNALGGFLALSLLASYYLILDSTKLWVQRLLAFTLPFQFFALSVTFSRSGLFAWCLGTLIFFLFLAIKKGNRQGWRFLSSVLLITIAINGALLHEQYWERGGIFNYNAVAKNADLERIAYQNNAFRMIQEHPWTGVGYKQYLSKMPYPHNIYLFLAVETGLISLAIFLFFIFQMLKKAVQLPANPLNASLLAMFIGLLFIGGCDFYPLYSQEGKLLFFCTAGLLASQLPKRKVAREIA